MKLIATILLSLVSLICYGQDTVYKLKYSNGQELYTTNVDSITHSIESNKPFQKIWKDGIATNLEIYDGAEILFEETNSVCKIFDKETDGIDAVISNSGEYCYLIDVDDEDKKQIACIGNVKNDNSL